MSATFKDKRGRLRGVLGASFGALLLACRSGGGEPSEEQVDAVSVPAPVEPAVPDLSWTKVELEPLNEDRYYVRAVPPSFGTNLSLPSSGAHDLMTLGPTLIVGPRGLYFEGERVADISNGHLGSDSAKVRPVEKLRPLLAESLKRFEKQEAGLGKEWFDTLVIFADESTKFSSLVNVLYTAGESGFTEYQFAVRSDHEVVPGSATIGVSPPKFSESGEPINAKQSTRVFILLDGVHFQGEMMVLSEYADRASLLTEFSKRIQALSAQTDIGDGPLPAVIFSAENDVELGMIVEVLSIAAGEHCDYKARRDKDRTKCFFPKRVVKAASG